MRITTDVLESVLFVGYDNGRGENATFEPVGTAFLVDDGLTYVVTVKHVALMLGDDPFAIRVNRTAGGSDIIHIDQDLAWFHHSDRDVDLAVAPLSGDLIEPDHAITAVPRHRILTPTMLDEHVFGLGDATYTVGLFSFMAGQKVNLPIVHSGSLAMLPGDERVPVSDWEQPDGTDKRRFVEAYLVESLGLRGLSGSPVFGRPPYDALYQVPPENVIEANVVMASRELFLIGIWQAAWDARPHEILAINRGQRLTVPVGMGVVVPATKLLEVLDMSAVMKDRERRLERMAASRAASLTSAPSPTSDENPTHREDFNSLLGKAARTPPQDD